MRRSSSCLRVRAAAWSSQDLVDTLSGSLVSRFKLLGAHTAEMGMTPRAIVERIDIVSHVGHCELSILLICFLIRPFKLLKEDSATALSQQLPFRLILGSR